MKKFVKVFSGSCLDLDDQDDFVMPRQVFERRHVLGSGADFFDAQGRPLPPQPRTMTKVFSGSSLDLSSACEDDHTSPQLSPRAGPRDTAGLTAFSPRATAKQSIQVAILGGGGYLSSHIVAAFLREGYSVRCTLSSLSDVSRVDMLQRLVPDASHRLRIVEAAIGSSRSLQDAIKGCRIVVHCGVPANPTDSAKETVDAHVRAAAALFEALSTIGLHKVDRLIVTGSASSVFHPTERPADGGDVFDESCWNRTASLSTDPLQFAKVQFEKEVWRLREVHRVDTTVIIPSLVIGPSKTTEISEAMRTLLELAKATSTFPFVPRMYWNFVDVRDVATAHVLAAETSLAKNERFIVSKEIMSLAELGTLIRKAHPHLTAPIYSAPYLVTYMLAPITNAKVTMAHLRKTLGVRSILSSKKSVEGLRLPLTDMETSVRDALEDLIRGGMLPPASAGAQAASGLLSPGCLCVTVPIVTLAASVLGVLLAIKSGRLKISFS